MKSISTITAMAVDLSARSVRLALLLITSLLYCVASLPVQAAGNVHTSSAQMDIEGTYEAIYEDGANGQYRLRHFLVTQDQRRELHLSAHSPAVTSGAKVRVHGVQQADGSISLDNGTLLTLASGGGADGGSNGGTPGVLANTLGEQRTLVLMVNFQENPSEQPLTVDQARTLVFGQVSNFFYENSYQQTTLAGDVSGWFTLPLSNTVCDLNAAGIAADKLATAAGINLGAYTRIVYLFTRTPCNVSGMATVGGIPSRTYINGQFTPDNIAHEMGHNFGLYHAHALDCQGVTLGDTCASIEYGDTYDTMGNPDFGHFNAFQKARLGWLGQSSALPIAVASSTGNYTLGVYETTNSDIKAVKIPRGINPLTGNQTWFYVEYRQATGFDSFLSKRSYRLYRQDVTKGVVIHLAEDNDANSSQLLQMHLDSPFLSVYGYTDWFDPALPVGNSYTDPVSGVTISVNWADGVTAGISVTLAQQNCVRNKPSVSLTAVQGSSVSAGGSLAYDVTVTSQDSSACPAAVFNLTSSLPVGWSGVFDLSTLQLTPGATAKARLTVTSATSTVVGSYSVNVSASNGSYSTTASGAYSVIKANLAPVATNDSVQLSTVAAVTIPVLANDYDPEGQSLTVVSLTQGTKGSVTLNANGTITYVPAKGFKGSDSFSYTISDGQMTASASVSITLATTTTTTSKPSRK